MSTRAKRILIVGGVAGGASAATRARRLDEHAEIVLFERGPDVSFANCGLPYHVGGAITERQRLLVQTPKGLRARFALDVRVRTEVVAIDRAAREVTARDLATGREYRERYDALVLSPGAAPVQPPLPGFDHPGVRTLRSLADMDAILELAGRPHARRAVVLGGGYVGLEMAEALRQRGLQVTLVEMLPQVMATVDPEMATPLHDELRRHGVDLRLGTRVEAFTAEGGLRARLDDGSALPCDLAVVAVGVRPETTLAREAGLALGPTGGILVDDGMQTSDPAIWAVGDAVEVRDFPAQAPALIPLAGPASRQGRVAADRIAGRDSRYRGTQGTAICKVFDLAIGLTGRNEKALRRAGVPFARVYLHPADHATYYPGARPLSLKLLFDPRAGTILGAQAVGAAGVDKRIDVIATALRAGQTVFDLEELELCYAPPFGSAKDPVNMAGFIAANVLRGDLALWEPEDSLPPRAGQLLLDVRTAAEHAAGSIPGAVLLPLDELRGRLSELPRDRELLVFCQVGQRAYNACRLLTQHGFRAANLSGGYKRYLMWREAQRSAQPRAEAVAAGV